MRVGNRYEVQARIAPSDVPTEELTSGLPGEASPTVDTLPVGPLMELKLHDPADAFRVVPITPAVQSVQERTVTRWVWSVMPLRSGRHTLILTATAMIGENRTPYQTYDAEITVQANPPVTIRSFWTANWQAILAALGTLGTLVLGVLTFMHSRKQRQANRQRQRNDGGQR
jgi:hypothetical protein